MNLSGNFSKMSEFKKLFKINIQKCYYYRLLKILLFKSPKPKLPFLLYLKFLLKPICQIQSAISLKFCFSIHGITHDDVCALPTKTSSKQRKEFLCLSHYLDIFLTLGSSSSVSSTSTSSTSHQIHISSHFNSSSYNKRIIIFIVF